MKARALRLAIFCHRWMGVALCPLFAWWFLSAFFMMYWDYPSVTPATRLKHARGLDLSKVRLTPEQAFARLSDDNPPPNVSLGMLDGRPFYRFGRRVVYADDGSVQGDYSPELLSRIAVEWTGRSASEAKPIEVKEPDQWTLGVRRRLPLLKYSFPDGQEVYIDAKRGEVVQYTTSSSRLFAYLGAISHWLYFTPLRVQQKLWTNIIVWASGIATAAALLGLIVGVWMYSPKKKYRHEGSPSSIPYSGWKRLHAIFGLFLGIVACTWSFSGMLSMEPFPQFSDGAPTNDAVGRIGGALESGLLPPTSYDLASIPRDARLKEVELSSFDGKASYILGHDDGSTRAFPMIDEARIIAMAADAAKPERIASQELLSGYDAYYRGRSGNPPLPVLRLSLSGPGNTTLYIDPATASLVGMHSDSSSFVNRWLYHGLHSMDFPWLYNNRPAWDIVVGLLLLGGFALCVTSVILAWRLVARG